MTLLPAMFMTVVVICCIIVAPEGLRQAYPLGLGIGLALASFSRSLFRSSALNREDCLSIKPRRARPLPYARYGSERTSRAAAFNF